MANLVWVYKHGAVGKVLTGTLTAGGAAAILTGRTMTLSARKTKTSTPILDNVDVTVVDALAGTISWTVTADAADPALVPENLAGYLLEFKAEASPTDVDYFPTNRDGQRTYGRLIVQNNLD